MRVLPCWWLGGAAAGAVLVGAFFIGCAALSPPAAPDEVERRERLEADREFLERRQEVIRSLVADLVEGRRGLRDAAAVWRAEDAGSPRHLRMRIELTLGQTEEERYAWSVLLNVQNRLEGDARAPAILARLEAELAALARDRPYP